MSDKDRSKDDDGNDGGSGGVGGGGGGDDEDGEERKFSKGCSRRGKRVTLFRLSKGKKIMGERRKEGVYVNTGCWWRRRRRRRSKIPGCFSCLKEPGTLDSSSESPTSDPNSSEFTFDLLRDLIEKNDFYSKECNTHLD